MRRKLNIKLLCWTTGCLLLSGTVVHLLHAYQVQRNASALLHQAERAVAEKEFQQAATYFSHYLVYEPRNTDALFHYGLALDRLTNSPPARFRGLLVLEQVLRREPARNDVRREAVRVAMSLYRFEDAARHLQVLLTTASDKGELEYRLGMCQEAVGDYAKAAASFGRAVAHDPRHLESYERLADVLQYRLEQGGQASKLLDDMVTANPQSYQAYLMRGRRHKAAGALDDAWRDITRAGELAPDQAEVLLAAAEMAHDKGDLKAARLCLERGLKLHPRDERLYKTLAWLESQTGRREQAVAWLRRGLEAVPDSGELRLRLADLLVDDRPGQEVTAELTRLRAQGQLPAVADCLEARLLIRQGQWGKATTLLEQARPQLPPSSERVGQADLLLGQCYEQSGDGEQQLAAYRRAVAFDPSWPLARLGLGAALLNVGRVNEALAELRQVSTRPEPPPQTWPLVVRALLLRNLALPEAQRNWQEVEQALEQAAAAADSPQRTVLRTEVLAAQQQFAQASTLLATAQKEQPGEVLLWTARADLDRRQGKFESALALLNEAEQRLGDQLALRLARLRYWSQRGGTQARIDLARLEQDLGRFRATEQTLLLRQLADTYYQLGDTAGAQRLWKDLAERHPRELRSRFLLFDLALHQGDDAAAERILDELRRIEGEEGVLWRYGAAAHLILRARRGDRQLLTEARKYLAEVDQRQHNWAKVALLEATIDEADGQREQAIPHYLRAVELGEAQPRVVARVAQLLHERRRDAEADQVLRKAEEMAPLGKDLARLGVTIALANQDQKRALALARQAVAADSLDYRDHLWLAQILTAAGEINEAEETLRRTLQKAGDIPDTWVSWIQHLVRTGQKDRAAAVPDEVRRQLPAERVPLTLARCYEALGQPERAEQLYRDLQAARPDDFLALRQSADFYLRTDQFGKAELLLRKLIEPATGAPAEIVVRARRQLAVKLAARPEPKYFQEALALLERNRAARSGGLDDERARAVVLATRPAHRREAIRIFEQTLNRQALSPEEQFVLVQLCEAEGDPGRARDLMLDLLAAHRHNPDYLTHLIRSLLQRREADEAQFYLDRLATLEPHSPRTRELQGSLRKVRSLKETPGD